ncbi:hypothetical protein MAR_006447 [Mya arenaria]|uniref:Uncharacterized protein n=1 Tax=Mya arenaria TaxID=6604 RepID=A0ABY7D8H5_MYAAR|nr:hypothetical protein MAR_006447 [Mya arenaria]
MLAFVTGQPAMLYIKETKDDHWLNSCQGPAGGVRLTGSCWRVLLEGPAGDARLTGMIISQAIYSGLCWRCASNRVLLEGPDYFNWPFFQGPAGGSCWRCPSNRDDYLSGHLIRVLLEGRAGGSCWRCVSNRDDNFTGHLFRVVLGVCISQGCLNCTVTITSWLLSSESPRWCTCFVPTKISGLAVPAESLLPKESAEKISGLAVPAELTLCPSPPFCRMCNQVRSGSKVRHDFPETNRSYLM